MEFHFRCEFYWRHFLEASAVGVPSLHRFRWQGNCGILSMPLYMFVVAVASSDLLCLLLTALPLLC